MREREIKALFKKTYKMYNKNPDMFMKQLKKKKSKIIAIVTLVLISEANNELLKTSKIMEVPKK